MNSRDFAYWLQGFFELQEVHTGLSVKQTDMVKNHLALVFKHEIDPSYGDKKHQAELNEIHNQPKQPQGWKDGKVDDGVIYRC